jgi:hypothetical protein
MIAPDLMSVPRTQLGMADDGDDASEDLDPAEAFLLTAHEIRLGILRALWRAENHSLSFSKLRKEVDVRDTGKFNYHLSKLDGRFVAHVEDRYELLYPGHRVVDAIQSGVFNQQVDREEIDLDGGCPDCGAPLAFIYEEFIARIRCRDCAETVLGYPFDPGGFAKRDDDAAVVRAFDRRTRRYWLSATDGVCPVCAGPTDVTLVDEATATRNTTPATSPSSRRPTASTVVSTATSRSGSSSSIIRASSAGSSSVESTCVLADSGRSRSWSMPTA